MRRGHGERQLMPRSVPRSEPTLSLGEKWWSYDEVQLSCRDVDVSHSEALPKATLSSRRVEAVSHPSINLTGAGRQAFRYRKAEPDLSSPARNSG